MVKRGVKDEGEGGTYKPVLSSNLFQGAMYGCASLKETYLSGTSTSINFGTYHFSYSTENLPSSSFVAPGLARKTGSPGVRPSSTS